MRKLLHLGFALAVITASIVAIAKPQRSILGADGTEYTVSAAPSAADYIQDGLILMWDGIENAGVGIHDPDASVWVDLVSGVELRIQSTAYWSRGGLVIDRQKNGVTTVFKGYPFFSVYSDAVDARTLTFETVYSLDYYGGTSGSGVNYLVRPTINIGDRPYGHLCPRSDNAVYLNVNLSGLGYYWKNATANALGIHSLSGSYSPNGIRAYCKLYIDGFATGSGGTYPTSQVSDADVDFQYLKQGTARIGPYGNSATNVSVDVIHNYRIYNRPLSDSEVYHNYLIDKERFGL